MQPFNFSFPEECCFKPLRFISPTFRSLAEGKSKGFLHKETLRDYPDRIPAEIPQPSLYRDTIAEILVFVDNCYIIT